MKAKTRLAAVLAATLTIGVLSRAASAETPAQSAAAQALFDEARKLMAAGRLTEACPKFEESQRLDSGSGTLMNLAVCYERMGRTASAWTTYLEAAAASRSNGKSDRARAAQERAAALAPKLARLIVDASANKTPSLEVRSDGILVRSPMWGTPVPTDPGVHAIVASAPGRQEWRTTVTLRESVTEKVAIPELKANPIAPATSALAPVAQSSSEYGAPKTVEEPATTTGSSQRIWAIGVGAVGVVGVTMGTVFGLQSKAAHEESQQYCSGAICPTDEGVEASNRARSKGNLSTASFIVGGVGLALGATLWFTAPVEKAKVGFGPDGIVVRREW
jgi:hypothetical protein